MSGAKCKSLIQLIPRAAQTLFDREQLPLGDIKKFDHETEATLSNQFGTSTSNATWTLKSNPNSTVYGATYTLDGSGSRQTYADIVTELFFTLLEPASYSLTASFDGFLVPDEESSASMNASLRRLNPPSGGEFSTGIGGRNFVGGTFQLGGEPLSGTLEPGDYHFDFSNALVIRAENDGVPMSGVGFGSGNGQFELSLDRLHPGGNPHVPEAGSTLAMLGTTLLGIALVRRRATASPC